MMPRIRAYAHHGPVPPNFLPGPSSATCAGTTGTASTPPLKTYWCELTDHNSIDAPGIGVTGYGSAAATFPDQFRFDLGYAPAADNFNVTTLGILIVGTSQPNAFDYTLVSPTGQCFPVPPVIVAGPMLPLPAWGNPASPFQGQQLVWNQSVPLAKGVWKIEVRQKTGTLVIPSDAFWASGVSYVQLFNAPQEGILAVEFFGTEVFPPPPTTPPPTTPPPTTPPPTTPAGGGCLCILLLVAALVLIAISAIAFVAWGCSGGFNPVLLVTATAAGLAGLALLGLWIALCRDCAAISFLTSFLIALAGLMMAIAALLALLGQFGCAQGAAMVVVLFLLVGLTLRGGGRAIGCP
jgi:hypothetical protein